MKVLSIILGILLTICGVICLFSPAESFLAIGYVIAIMLLVYGIAGTISVIAKQFRPAVLWASIPALIIGIVSLFVPSDTSTIHVIILYLLAFFFIVQGIMSIYMSVRTRHIDGTWVLGLILGIISIILGVYTAVHPLIGVFAIGILVGIWVIETGIELIVVGSTIGRVERFVNKAKNIVNEARDSAHEASAEQNASDSEQ